MINSAKGGRTGRLFYCMCALCKIFLVAAVLSLGVYGQALESVYSDLSEKQCRTIELNEDEGGWYRGRCKGIGGYDLEVTEGDLRQSLIVIAADGKTSDLELTRTVSSAFSSLGPKAEWRVKRNGSKLVPSAVIVRYTASEDPAKPEKSTSFLVVAKITPNATCVTDVVNPGVPQQNTRARELADTASSRPCKGTREN